METIKIISSKKNQLREARAFYMFIAPWLIGFFGLTLGPMLYSLYGALSDWGGVLPPVFIGVDNFLEIFTNDPEFWKSFSKTLYYVVVSVPTSVAMALFLAFMLNNSRKATGLFQAIFYFPSVCSGIAVYMVWIWIFNSETGVFNYLLSLIGIKGPMWITDTAWAMPSLIIMNLTFCGGQMLIFIAGLKQIPSEYYEAATIDGASKLKQFGHITLPLLGPIILFNTIMGMIGAFQMFGQPFILTGGGPMRATYVFGIYIYESAFLYFKFGYAAALSWVMFLMLIVLSLIVMKYSDSKVNYDI